MGIIGKIKNIFYDEEIVEVPVEEKKEDKPRIEEVELPKKEATVIETREAKPLTNSYSERELFKSEPTFKFPLIDDEEEKEEIPLRSRSKAGIGGIGLESKRKAEQAVKKEETLSPRNETKAFTPSPVISPVYGILDKNYKKEEIIEKKDIKRPSPTERNYDYVRRKAYGTLEDELEDTLTKMSTKIIEEVSTLTEEIENIDSDDKSLEELLNEIENNTKISIGELEEAVKDRMEEEEDKLEELEETDINTGDLENDNLKEILEKEEDKGITEEKEVIIEKEEEIDDSGEEGKTLEHDLFNLIDSMYEESEGE